VEKKVNKVRSMKNVNRRSKGRKEVFETFEMAHLLKSSIGNAEEEEKTRRYTRR